jgi:hypothetical protein
MLVSRPNRMFKRQCVGQCNSTESDTAILVFGALMNPCKEAGYVLEDQNMTEKRHDTQVVWRFAHRNASEVISLAADKGTTDAITQKIPRQVRKTAN